jgi:hypothetical protein
VTLEEAVKMVREMEAELREKAAKEAHDPYGGNVAAVTDKYADALRTLTRKVDEDRR